MTSPGGKGHVSHRRIAARPRAALPLPRTAMTSQADANTGLIHRPVPHAGLRSKQAVSMATAASGHASAFLDAVAREDREDACARSSRTRGAA